MQQVRPGGLGLQTGQRLAARARASLPRGQTLPRKAWDTRHRALFLLLLLHAIALPALAMLHGDDVGHALSHGAAIGSICAVAYVFRRRRRAASSIVSLGLITCSALLVHVTGGVIEAHFHFFVMIVVLALYEDWVPFLLAAAYVVVHHGVAGALAPHDVYNHPDAIAHPWRWALIHGAFVTAAGVASLAAWRLNESARSETELAHRETRQILATAHDPFISIDERGRIIDCNPQAEATFGWPCEAMLGRELAETIIAPQHREGYRRGMAHFLATGEGPILGKRLELPALHREGYQFPVELTISALETERGPTFNIFLRDLSEEERQRRYLDAQHRVQTVMAEAERVSDAVPRLLAAIGESMSWDYGAYWGFAGGGLYVDMSWKSTPGEFDIFDRSSKEKFLPPGVGLPGRVLQHGRPEYVEDVTVDGNFTRIPAAKKVGLRTAVAIPMEVQGEPRGVLEFFSRGSRHPEPELLETMQTLTGTIARFFSIIADREELRGTLERLALTDALTSLPNRRAWTDGLEREIARAGRSEQELCVALIDLDGFKRYNDSNGHAAGDELLRGVSASWSECLRATDLLARLGGDEFALAFPGQPAAEAAAVLERLRTALPGEATCSVGLARWTPGETPYEVMSRADVALYEAKEAGRDRVVVADDRAGAGAAG
jgi:diguanylate cyclase (GGDEF)-like protein/PAS domain S-box-containing protein